GFCPVCVVVVRLLDVIPVRPDGPVESSRGCVTGRLQIPRTCPAVDVETRANRHALNLRDDGHFPTRDRFEHTARITVGEDSLSHRVNLPCVTVGDGDESCCSLLLLPLDRCGL